MKVDESLTRRVAELSRLQLTDSEAQTFAAQFNDILQYVAQLQKVDVSQVEPLTYPLEITTPLREDIVKPFAGASVADGSEDVPPLLQSAAEVSEGAYQVPKVL